MKHIKVIGIDNSTLWGSECDLWEVYDNMLQIHISQNSIGSTTIRIIGIPLHNIKRIDSHTVKVT